MVNAFLMRLHAGAKDHQASRQHPQYHFHAAYKTFRKYYQSGLPLIGTKLEKSLTLS